jgi:hypothetical protein
MRDTVDNLEYIASMTQKIKDSICATEISNCFKCCCGRTHSLKANKWEKCNKIKAHEKQMTQEQLFDFLMYRFLYVFFKHTLSPNINLALFRHIVEFAMIHEKTLTSVIALDFFTRLAQYQLQFNSRSETIYWLQEGLSELGWCKRFYRPFMHFLQHMIARCMILGRNEAESQRLLAALLNIYGPDIEIYLYPQLLIAQFDHVENVIVGFKGVGVCEEDCRYSCSLCSYQAEKVYIEQFVITPEQEFVHTKTKKKMNGIEVIDMLNSEKEKAISSNNDCMVVIEPVCEQDEESCTVEIDGRMPS